MKVYIVNSNAEYDAMYVNRGWTITYNMFEADLVQFTGGQDVSPKYYGEQMHPKTYVSEVRDAVEISYFNFALEHKIPMVGICRGGQFLHVMNGGDLWQHVYGHDVYRGHEVMDVDTGVKFHATSRHHQMMRHDRDYGELVLVGSYPTDDEGEHGIRFCHEPIKEHVDREGEIEEIVSNFDIEAIYYDDTRCFCFQPHPEYTDVAEQCNNFYFNKIEQFFNLK